MSAIVTPNTKSPAKPYYLVAAVLVAALVVVAALAIGAWAANDRGGSTAPTRAALPGNVESVNAASPELQSVNVSAAPLVQSVNAPDSAIAHFAQAEGLTGLSPASLHQSVNVTSPAPSAQSLNAASPELQSVSPSPAARSVTASECRLTGPC